MDLGTGLGIIAAAVYVVETAGKYGYSLLKKSQERPLETTQAVGDPFKKKSHNILYSFYL